MEASELKAASLEFEARVTEKLKAAEAQCIQLAEEHPEKEPKDIIVALLQGITAELEVKVDILGASIAARVMQDNGDVLN